MAKATIIPNNEVPGPCGVKITRFGGKQVETIGLILRKIRAEVTDLLKREPKYHGKVVLSLNFKEGRFMNMHCNTGKMILGEKGKG